MPVAPTLSVPTIKTPQELVHIRHQITLRQYKYWVLMLKAYREAYEADTPKTDEGFHQISLAELTGFLGYMPQHKELREDLEAIRKEAITYNILGKDGKQTMRGAGFISEWSLSAGDVGFKLPGFLAECVENLDLRTAMFQALNWAVFNSFSGKYEAILYKLCRDYAGVGRTPYLTVDAMREYMGISEHEYPLFKDFSKYVVTGPVRKINASPISDISLTVEYTRNGRSVAGLQFTVVPRRQSALDFGDDPAFGEAKVSIPLKQQRAYLETYPAAEVALSIQRANEFAAEKEKLGVQVSLGAVYRTAIMDNWGKDLSAKLKRDEEQAELAATTAKIVAETKAESVLATGLSMGALALANTKVDQLTPAELQTEFACYQREEPSVGVFASGVGSALFRAWLRRKLSCTE